MDVRSDAPRAHDNGAERCEAAVAVGWGGAYLPAARPPAGSLAPPLAGLG